MTRLIATLMANTIRLDILTSFFRSLDHAIVGKNYDAECFDLAASPHLGLSSRRAWRLYTARVYFDRHSSHLRFLVLFCGHLYGAYTKVRLLLAWLVYGPPPRSSLPTARLDELLEPPQIASYP